MLGLPLSEREKAEFMLFYENEELARLMFKGVEQWLKRKLKKRKYDGQEDLRLFGVDYKDYI